MDDRQCGCSCCCCLWSSGRVQIPERLNSGFSGRLIHPAQQHHIAAQKNIQPCLTHCVPQIHKLRPAPHPATILLLQQIVLSNQSNLVHFCRLKDFFFNFTHFASKVLNAQY